MLLHLHVHLSPFLTKDFFVRLFSFFWSLTKLMHGMMKMTTVIFEMTEKLCPTLDI